MAREAKTTTINGISYSVVPLGSKEARRVALRFGKVIGAMKKGDFGSVTDDDTDFLCETFAKYTTVNFGSNRNPQLDTIIEEHFNATEFSAMIQWLGFCVEVNFGDFLAGHYGITPEELREMVKPNPNKTKGSDSTKASTTSSGSS